MSHILRSETAPSGKARSVNNNLYYISITVLSTSILQIYLLQIGSTYLPLALISLYASAVYLFLETEIPLDRLTLLLFSLFSVEAISIVWSPDRLSGVRDIIFGLPFLFSFLIGRALYLKSPHHALNAIKLYCVLGIFQSALVILFRLMPALESHFLRSGMAEALINPNSLHEFFDISANNINAPDKAGGLLLNANVAGVWCAVMTFIALAVPFLGGHREKRSIWYIVALIHSGAVLACGSKAALGLLFATPILARFAITFRQLQSFAGRVALVFVSGASGVLAFWFLKLWLASTGFGQEILVTSIRRLAIWEFAWAKFRGSPWLGLGYGGWERAFAPYGEHLRAFGLLPTLPPHNALIILWAESGILAAIIGALIVVAVVGTTISIAGRSPGKNILALWASSAVLFFYIQSMGENFGIFGEVHAQAPLAFFIGVAAGYLRTAKA